MLQAAIGRVNARAGEERRIIPERDEKTLILVDGLVVELLCGLSQRVQQPDDHIKTISRADVLNLTSAEAAHNHPKLYKKTTASKASSKIANPGSSLLLNQTRDCRYPLPSIGPAVKSQTAPQP